MFAGLTWPVGLGIVALLLMIGLLLYVAIESCDEDPEWPSPRPAPKHGRKWR